MKNKPFDLQKALAGEPVVTGSNEKAEYVCTVKNARNGTYHVFKCHFIDSDYGQSEAIYHFNDLGEGFQGLGMVRAGYVDLFMAPVKKTVWVNIWKSTYGAMFGSSPNPFSSEDEAKKMAICTQPNYIGTYPIEIEL